MVNFSNRLSNFSQIQLWFSLELTWGYLKKITLRVRIQKSIGRMKDDLWIRKCFFFNILNNFHFLKFTNFNRICINKIDWLDLIYVFSFFCFRWVPNISIRKIFHVFFDAARWYVPNHSTLFHIIFFLVVWDNFTRDFHGFDYRMVVFLSNTVFTSTLLLHNVRLKMRINRELIPNSSLPLRP